MIEYITDKNGKPINIRRLAGAGLEHFPWPQGAASDGKYIYMVFERKAIRGFAHRCRIVKLDARTFTIRQVSGNLRLGHGNDITYRDGVLYITHSAGRKLIHRVDARTLEQMSGIDVVIPEALRRKRIGCFNGICCFGKGYMLRVMYGSGMLVTNENFVGTRYFRTGRLYKTSQGMDQKNRTTYRAFSTLQSSDRNFLITFDDDGKVIKKKTLEITGELESVFFVGDQLYGSVYRKTQDAAGRWRRATYLFRVVDE